MKTDTRDLVSATKAARDFASITARVACGSRVVVLKNNEPSVAIVPMADMEQLDRVAEREEDMRLLAVALTRIATDDGGGRKTLEEFASELGVDLDD
ncbi:type II toxin-antitoxin system prevent-host-death family antitoxin [Demequina sp. SYSU T00192]|uniref:Type II toxin-antitoxin system prevent-host-death family antitoxin n=1 Tax=Demequina litoralis TaxID=3051660 RepID=A0ABT8G5Y3_9MICO|nr:type II toxin-antitoxin system prevent-host-death family antitoxin [Demequina sp. SYSU T00192]MDN4474339.1 type II toxin-antitoxin system prevent-host-death family antitoxin [Demequina sp. SYSU T00192]